MILLNIIYTPKYNSNLILLGQLWKSEILYYNHPNFMILRTKVNTFGIANRYNNFFGPRNQLKSHVYKRKRLINIFPQL